MMLLVVVLMSILMVLCTRMWRSTAYVIDIALQKQVHMQKKYAVRGVLNCGVAACKKNFSAVHDFVIRQGGTVTVPLQSYYIDIPHLAHYIPNVTFTLTENSKIQVTGELCDGKKAIITMSCDVCGTMLSHNARL